MSSDAPVVVRAEEGLTGRLPMDCLHWTGAPVEAREVLQSIRQIIPQDLATLCWFEMNDLCL